MRLFVGVELDHRVRDMAARVASDLKRKLGTHLDARWVPAENMHLTVRFVGYVADAQVPAVLDALGRSLDFNRFEIEFAGCGRFPPRGAPRVIWIGLATGLTALTALHEEFDRRLAPLGFEAENRPYSAHLTLARVKDARASAQRQIEAAFDSVHVDSVAQTVAALTVFESRLSPHGPTYSPLRSLPLRA